MSEPHSPSRHLQDFFRYTLRPTFSSRFGIVTFPSVEAMMMVFPDAEGPNSFERSTLIVSVVPSTVISTFFMMVSSPPVRLGEPQRTGLRSIGTAEADYIGSLIIDSSRYGESVESSKEVECPLFQHDVSAARRVAQYIARH